MTSFKGYYNAFNVEHLGQLQGSATLISIEIYGTATKNQEEFKNVSMSQNENKRSSSIKSFKSASGKTSHCLFTFLFTIFYNMEFSLLGFIVTEILY